MYKVKQRGFVLVYYQLCLRLSRAAAALKNSWTEIKVLPFSDASELTHHLFKGGIVRLSSEIAVRLGT